MKTSKSLIIFVAVAAFFLGLSGGYVLGHWRAAAYTTSERPSVFGLGTELIDTPRDPSGKPFQLTSTFGFSHEFFHCMVATNDQPFSMKTHAMGEVQIGKNQFFMSVDSVRIDSAKKQGGGRVELVGMARSITRVGDKYEDAVVPFSAVAVDGGPGRQNDTLVLSMTYDPQSSPMQYAIFGPSPRFGQPTNILSGDISVSN